MRDTPKTPATTATPDRAQLAEALRRAVEELADPELTLDRSAVLRPRVAAILRAIRESGPSPGRVTGRAGRPRA